MRQNEHWQLPLTGVRGRLTSCKLRGGDLYSQDLDDVLFQIKGLLDYRATIDSQETDRLNIAYLAAPATNATATEITRQLMKVPAVAASLTRSDLRIGGIQQVEHFAATHTVKRTILDRRTTGETDATRA